MTLISLERVRAKIALHGPEWARRSENSKYESTRLASITLEELKEAGLLSLLAPSVYGGQELDWPTFSNISRSVATYCPSTAWAVGVVGAHIAIANRLPDICREYIYSSSSVPIVSTASLCNSFSLTRRGKNWLLSGEWNFCSLIEDADWVILFVPDQVAKRCLVSSDLLSICDNWDANGLQLTGTKSVSLDKVLINDECMFLAEEFYQGTAQENVNTTYMYHVAIGPYLGSFCSGPLLGCTEAAVMECNRIVSNWSSKWSVSKSMISRLAIANIELQAIIAIFDGINNDLHVAGCESRNLTFEEDNSIRARRAHMATMCWNIVSGLMCHMGATTASKSSRIRQLWDDLQVICLHRDFSSDLGLEGFGEDTIRGCL